jgi:hypothetical protein
MNNMLIVAKSKKEYYQYILITIKLLMQLGWTINWNKLNLRPSQIQIFLGLKVESYNIIFKIPSKKVRGIMNNFKNNDILSSNGTENKIAITSKKYRENYGDRIGSFANKNEDLGTTEMQESESACRLERNFVLSRKSSIRTSVVDK